MPEEPESGCDGRAPVRSISPARCLSLPRSTSPSLHPATTPVAQSWRRKWLSSSPRPTLVFRRLRGGAGRSRKPEQLIPRQLLVDTLVAFGLKLSGFLIASGAPAHLLSEKESEKLFRRNPLSADSLSYCTSTGPKPSFRLACKPRHTPSVQSRDRMPAVLSGPRRSRSGLGVSWRTWMLATNCNPLCFRFRHETRPDESETGRDREGSWRPVSASDGLPAAPFVRLWHPEPAETSEADDFRTPPPTR